MINWEHQLVTKIIETGDIKTAIKGKVSIEVLKSSETRAIFKFLFEGYLARGSVPSKAMVEEVFPKFKFPKVEEELPHICDFLIKSYIAGELRKAAAEASELSDSNPVEAADVLNSSVIKLLSLSNTSKCVDLASSMADVKRDYEINKELLKTGKVRGIAFPWPTLTRESMGMIGGDFVMFYGRMGTMKSWMLCHMAAHAYAKSHKRVLMFTREMPPELVRGRVLCSIAEVDYSAYKKSQLEPSIEKEFFAIADQLTIEEKNSKEKYGTRRHKQLIITADDRSEGGGISSLQAMIEEHDPDIVFIDGIYLMRDDRQKIKSREWKNIANITSDIKMLARRFDIPIVGNSQANRMADDKKRGNDMRDLSFSDAVGQDPDLVIRTALDAEPNGEKVLKLIIGKAREFSLEGLVIGAQPATDFRERRLLRGGEAKETAQRDDRVSEVAQKIVSAAKQTKILETDTRGTSYAHAGVSTEAKEDKMVFLKQNKQKSRPKVS
jgi:replicative DNA helicase